MKGDFKHILSSVETELYAIQKNLAQLQDIPRLDAKALSAVTQQLGQFMGEVQKSHVQSTRLPKLTKKTVSRQPTSSDMRGPIRNSLAQERIAKTLSNPQKAFETFSAKFNVQRELRPRTRPMGKTTYAKPRFNRLSEANVLPKQYREDPTLDPPPITMDILSRGMLELINQGRIPKEVDLTPAFERGKPILSHQPAKLNDWREKLAVPYEPKMLALPPPEPMLTAFHTVSESSDEEPKFQIALYNPSPTEVKNYDSVMDAYSVHNVIIRRGKVLTSTPEYTSFKRTQMENWAPIANALVRAEGIFSQHGIGMVVLDGHKLAEFVCDELKSLRDADILECVVNKSQVLPFMKSASYKFRLSDGPHFAAVLIQKHWRRYHGRTAYLQLLTLIHKATLIQTYYRLYLKHKALRAEIAQFRAERLQRLQALQQKLTDNWSEVQAQPRLEIHIGHFSPNLPVPRHNENIGSIFSLKDPNCNVVFLTAEPIDQDIQTYYLNILELREVNDPQDRLSFISPSEIPGSLPHSAAFLARLCPRTLRTLKRMTKNKPGYIVTSRLTPDEIAFAGELGLPLIGGDLDSAMYTTTKSGGKLIYELSDIPVPPSLSDNFSQESLVASLAKLILSNPSVDQWLVKLNNETCSRGIAVVNVSQSRVINELKRNPSELAYQKLKEVLTTLLPEITRFVMPSRYENWEHYATFLKDGAVIEGTPPTAGSSMSVVFFLAPSGEVSKVWAYDKLAVTDFVSLGVLFPQNSLPNLDVLTFCRSIGSTLIRKGIWGHVKADLAVFSDPAYHNRQPLFWAVDLTIGLSLAAGIFEYFDFLSDGYYDLKSNRYYIESCVGTVASPKHDISTNIIGSRETNRSRDLSDFELGIVSGLSVRSFFFVEHFMHSMMASLNFRSFFNLCKKEAMHFDLEFVRGSSFLMYNRLSSKTLGCLSVGMDRLEAFSGMSEVCQFLLRSLGPLPKANKLFRGVQRDDIFVAELVAKIKFSQRIMEKA
jgi:hypothetical protein